jgi:uncharacterized protein YegL/DNA-directed RNA polymerase subunit RPC12/RpoP
MIGEPLKAVQSGVQSLVKTLRRNPHALEAVWLSVITFDAKARVTTPFTELSSFMPPALSVKPGTALGAALSLLQQSIEKDVVKTSAEVKGDFKPLVFILTDGQPTDDWKKKSKNILKTKSKIAYIYTIGCGEEVNFEIMGKISDACFHLKELTDEAMAKLFVWLSTSISTCSAAIDDGPVDLEKAPLGQGLQLVDLSKPPQFVKDKWSFLHVVCNKTGQYFLSRYRLDPETELYMAEDAHPLPLDFFSEGQTETPTFSADMFHDYVECPYCGNESWFHCGKCNTLNCLSIDDNNTTVVCAKCGDKGRLVFDNNFTFDGSVG